MLPVKSALFLAVLFFLIAIQLVCYWSLPYRSSLIRHVSLEEARREPAPTPNFRLGGIEWNVELYRQTPKLELFRQYFRLHCHDLTGIRAAICISENLRQTIPFGAPRSEFFHLNYSPKEDFLHHLKGEAGHCVTFSALTATTLLSVGIPARVAQILPKDGRGHTVTGVWDEKEGWAFFDPLNGETLSDGNKLISAWEALEDNNKLKYLFSQKSGSKQYLSEYYKISNPFDGAVVYPEPWLYTRVEERTDLNFYRGEFISFGENYWWLGRAQVFLRYSIFVCSLFSLILFIYLIKRFLLQFSEVAQENTNPVFLQLLWK